MDIASIAEGSSQTQVVSLQMGTCQQALHHIMPRGACNDLD